MIARSVSAGLRVRVARGAVAFATLFAVTGLAAPADAARTATSPFIVQASSTDAAAAAVNAVGGDVENRLDIIEGVAANLTAAEAATLARDANVAVTPDTELHATSASFAAAGPPVQITAMHPAPDWAADAGDGVGVALVDTGVADNPGLDPAQLVRGPDFSGEGDGIDHFGHGTFMAGLIAGTDTGVAPGAHVVSVKVAGASGATSVSKVIAGIGWAVENADDQAIGVLSLSFSVDTPMPYYASPLSAAVETAWASGITVVAASGNRGSDGVTSPGDDPYVLSVGATDTGTTGSVADDTVPSWSGRETFHGYSKPDVVAPGVSVISLRAPGSTIDDNNPQARVETNYFRGTGTSMSTALVAGAAAVLLEHHPLATPDDVKGAIVDGAVPLATGERAVDMTRADAATARPQWWQHFKVALNALGPGPDAGNGMPWSASRWTDDSWNATRWAATRWAATRWAATRWAASRWAASRWANADWDSTRWADTEWAAAAWSSQRWG